MGHHPWISRTFVRSAMSFLLDTYGADRRDRWAAALMGAWISALHRECVGPDHIRINYIPQHPERHIAECPQAEKGQPLEYRIYLSGLWANMCTLARLNLLVRDGKLDKNLAIIAIAAHEVRHRLQQTGPGVPLFCKDASGERDDLKKTITVTLAEEFTERWRQLIDQKADLPTIELYTGLQEFDATFIDRLVMRRFGRCRSLAAVARLVKSIPEGA